MQYRTSSYAEDVFDTYYFEKNLQGDIVSVYNASGTKLISYSYDAWGNHTTYTHTANIGGAQYNPFRYRGYYYDSDMGFYYLNDRYYDSITGRFLTPDDPSYLGANGDLLSYNLFAYCFNNPVMYVDPTGHMPEWLGWAFSGIAIAVGVGLCATGAGGILLYGEKIMKIDYNMYYKNNLIIPAIVLIVAIIFLIINICFLINNSNIKSKHYYYFSVFISIVFFILSAITLSNGMFLFTETEEDAIIFNGEVSDIISVSNSPRYYLNDEACRAIWVYIEDQKFYMIDTKDIAIGDTIEFTYLPKSRFVLAYDIEGE